MTVPFPRTSDRQCAWIEGDPSDKNGPVECCGQYVPPGRTFAFCDEHMRRVAPVGAGTPSERDAVRTLKREMKK